MSLTDLWEFTLRFDLPLSNIERKVLRTLVTMKVGNAYVTWKASGLKHYPTVLRSLKKLEEKGCVEAMKKGMRGEKRYVLTFLGMLASLALEGNLAKIREVISNNSPKFRDLVEANVVDIDDWAHSIFLALLHQHASMRQKEKRKKSIDEILEEEMYKDIDAWFTNIQTEPHDAILKIVENARAVKWVQPIAVKALEGQIDWWEKQVEALKKTKEKITKT